ncbi:MAG: hypothetical protein KKD38_00715 [Candidatus Delongbacteria bacterium]|nr:hypothetical protein [Candidatus Delongbacteria bacterium]MCG2761252.1 hypothetical protein [Candidatus Delongbacteria bacterium]
MKKIIITAVFAIVYQSYALFGIGGHVGLDDTSVPSQEINVLSINSINYDYTLTRDEIKNPLALGAQLYFDLPIIPIGFEVGFEGAWASYKWTGSDNIGGISFNLPEPYKSENGMYDEKFDFTKMCVDVTGKWYIFSLPPVVKTLKFYVGGGAGFYFITPIVTDKMIIAELEKKYTGSVDTPVTFDVDKYIEKITVFGYHFVAGIQLKLPVMPVSLNVDYKYVVTPENDYKDETNKFGVIKGSLNFYI